MTPSRTLDDVIEPGSVATRYRKLIAVMSARVAGLADTDWTRPSPCAGWTVQDVVQHVVQVQSWPLHAAGAGVEDIPSAAEEPIAAWAAASSKLAALLDDAELAAVSIEVAVAGWMPTAAAVDLIVCGDLVVHTWDLSRATGQDEHIEPVEVARTRAAVEFLGEETLRRPGLYGEALNPPTGADAQTELLAYLGRRAWGEQERVDAPAKGEEPVQGR